MFNKKIKNKILLYYLYLFIILFLNCRGRGAYFVWFLLNLNLSEMIMSLVLDEHTVHILEGKEKQHGEMEVRENEAYV